MVSTNGFRSFASGLGVLVLSLGLPAARASIINVQSNGGLDEFNVENGGLPNPDVAIDVSPSWAPSGLGYEWVSYGATGCNTFVALTGMCTPGVNNPAGAASPITLPDPSTPTAIFFNQFTLPSGDDFTGSLSIWADDTARVYLNGVLLIDANPDPGSNCAGSPIGCLPNMDYTVDLSTPGLLDSGINTLQIEAYQLSGGSPFGVMYNGSIDAEPSGSPTPEPASCLLLGLGLAAVGFLRQRAKRT
jgi:hypothetical protein